MFISHLIIILLGGMIGAAVGFSGIPSYMVDPVITCNTKVSSFFNAQIRKRFCGLTTTTTTERRTTTTNVSSRIHYSFSHFCSVL